MTDRGNIAGDGLRKHPVLGVDTVGAWLTVGTAAAYAAHGVIKGIQNAGKKKENGSGPPGSPGPAGQAGSQS